VKIALPSFLAWLLLAGALLLGACRPERDPRELVVAVDAPVKDLDPRLATDGPSARLSRMVFRGLTQVDPHGNPALDLAARLTEDGDPLTIVADLPPGLRWHDGAPLTARDVEFTYQTVLDPRFATPIGGEFRRRFAAVHADPHNPLRVRFVLRRPLATLWSDLVLGIAPAHLLEHTADRRFAGPLVGSGAWQVIGAASGDRVTLQRVGPTPHNHAERLTFRAIADEGARSLSVLGGGADLAWSGLSPAILQGAAKTGRAKLHAAPGIAWVYLGLNLRQPPLHLRNMRQALAKGIDRRAVIDTLIGGLASPAPGMFAPGHWAHTALPSWDHDPAAAEKLLDQAGLPRQANGWRFALEIKVSTSRLRRSVGRALAEQLRQIGIDASVRPFELATFLADVRAGRFEAFLLQLPEPFEPDQLAWMLHSQNAAVRQQDGQSQSPYAQLPRDGLPDPAWDAPLDSDSRCAGWRKANWRERARTLVLTPLGLEQARGLANRTSYADPWLDCWVDLGREALDRPTRAALYALAQQKAAEDLPIIPMWWEHQAVLAAPHLQVPPLPADGRYSVLGEVSW
jgi:peptide/nickel transport system substrate-binding protein